MIPKVIHYCWFGGNPLPELAKRCISSWKKYLPDYEIKEWNENNFDINIIPYTKEAYQAKKYAFVSDYARFWILYHYGGLYFDTDVEVIRPMDGIISQGAFMGCEKDAILNNNVNSNLNTFPVVAPGLGLGCSPGMAFYKQILELYNQLHFVNENGKLNLKTVVTYTTEILCEHGLKNISGIQRILDINIYPKEYFCPTDNETNKCIITKNTYTIHHYAGSWLTIKGKIRVWLIRKISYCIRSIKHFIATNISKKK